MPDKQRGCYPSTQEASKVQQGNKKTPKTTPMTSPYLKPFPTLYYGSSSISEGASNYDPPAHLKDQLPMQSNLRQN